MAVTINGTTGIETNIDTGKLKVGSDDDLEIYHSGTDSYIQNETGVLRINNDGTDLVISTDSNIHLRTNGTEEAVKAIANGAVELYHDNSKKLETYANGVNITGGIAQTGYLDIDSNTSKLRLGDGQEFEIYHNGSSSYISNDATNGGNLAIESDGYVWIGSKTGSETYIKGIKDGSVELYHNNFKSFRTHENGIVLYGPEGGDGHLIMYADEGDDNADFWRLTAGADGDWVLYNYASGSYEKSFSATGNGSVKLWNDNVQVLETHSGGIKVGEVGSTQEIWFPDSNNADEGLIRYRHDEDWMSFITWGSERFRIEDNGDLLAHDTTIGLLSSDNRLKKNVADYNYDLAKFKQLRPRTFEWINTSNHEHPTGTQKGFIAQEVETVDTSLTMEVLVDEANTADRALLDADGKSKSTKLGGHDTLYVSVIQQLITKIETLETKVAALEAA